MKRLKKMSMCSFLFSIQTIKRFFGRALFLTYPFYLSSIFAAGREGFVIKKEPEETIAIKQEEPQGSENIHPVKEEPSEVISKKIPTPDIYKQLWEKAQNDENLSEVKDIMEQYSIDCHKKNHEGKTVGHIALQSGAVAIVKYLAFHADYQKTMQDIVQNIVNDDDFMDSRDNTAQLAIISKGLLSVLTYRFNDQPSVLEDAVNKSKKAHKTNVHYKSIVYKFFKGALAIGSLEHISTFLESGAGLITQNEANMLHLAAEKITDKTILEYLIHKWKEVGLSIDQTNKDEFTPLMVAVRFRNIAAAKVLMEANAKLDISNTNKENVLHLAASHLYDRDFIRSLVKRFQEEGLSIDEVNQSDHSPLMCAMLHSNLYAVESLIDAKDPNDNLGSILHWIAIHLKHPTVLRYVIRSVISKSQVPNVIDLYQIDDDNKHTPLMKALLNGNLSAIDAFIEAKASLILCNNNLENVLHWIAKHIKDQTVLAHVMNKLIKKNQTPKVLNIDQRDHYGYTPLMIAALHSNLAAVEAFTKAGAKLDILTPNKQNALHLAAAFVKNKVFFQSFIKLFQQSKSKQVKAQVNQQDQKGYTPLMIALLNSNIITAKELMSANAKLDILTPIQNSILHIAVSRIKDKDFLQFLIKKCKDAKLDINQKNQKGLTPLMTAVVNSNQEAIRELIKAQAGLMHPEPNADKSILHFAGKYAKDKATVQYLMSKYKYAGLDINPRDQKSYTPLMMAVKKGNKEAIDAFIDSGATVAVSRDIGNILHFAAMHVKDKTLFQHLMNKCKEVGLIDIYQANQKGYTPFMVASLSMNLSAIEALIELDAKLNLNVKQESSLHAVVCHVKDKAFIKLLMKTFKEANLSIDNINEDGHTPLMVAVLNGNLAAAGALIEENAQLHLLTKENENALHLAAAYVKDKVFVEFLINAFKKAINSMDNSDQEHTNALEYESMKKNLDINLMTQYKQTALMVAVLNGNLAAIDALIEGGITLFVPTENTENIVDFANRCVNSKRMIEHLRKKCFVRLSYK